MVLLSDEVISQYRHGTKLETLFNTVIVMIKATAPVVFHHLVQSFPSILHQASIRWLKTDSQQMELSSPAQSSSPPRLCSAAIYPFSVPQSALLTLGVPPSCWTQSTTYLEVTVGSLLVYPTSGHKIHQLNLLMVPWKQKPNGFNLS